MLGISAFLPRIIPAGQGVPACSPISSWFPHLYGVVYRHTSNARDFIPLGNSGGPEADRDRLSTESSSTLEVLVTVASYATSAFEDGWCH